MHALGRGQRDQSVSLSGACQQKISHKRTDSVSYSKRTRAERRETQIDGNRMHRTRRAGAEARRNRKAGLEKTSEGSGDYVTVSQEELPASREAGDG
ncbi:hypothetical protein DPEC_G00034790 [Dallia pectoralis]|uniref:Uncharacterized protein n=1 Tax=Dallia pectoralis TaxID=75939 RepID=A0ACC2HD57_DALPE|nr:hypothetical protein DPEC_G00034790 [Dallia pectoralis]